MPKSTQPSNGSSLNIDTPLVRKPVSTLLVVTIVVAALFFAREVLIPLALAVLLSFALGPLLTLLRRLHFGRAPSVVATVLLAFLLILGIGALFANQVTQLAEDLPRYQYNLTEKIRSVQHMTAERGIFGRASLVLKALSNEIDKTAVAEPTPAPGSANAPAEPLLVQVREPRATPIQILQAVVEPLLQPLATAGLVILFVVLFLFRREDLRDRFIRLMGSGDLRRTTVALDDAVGRVSRYLLLQITINLVFGVLIGIGLWLIGIPNPLLWGVMAMLLRFVPYVGPIIALIFEKAREATKSKLATEICQALTVHAQVEEELFYPAARQALGDDGEDLLDEAKVEHTSLKELIANIEGAGSDDELFDAHVKVLGEYTKHHVKEEEGELFPKCRKSEMDLVSLGTKMAARKKELMGKPAKKAAAE